MKNKDNIIQNKKLYKALSALTQKSLEIISKSFKKDLVVTTESTWQNQGDDIYARYDIERPLWVIIVNRAKGEIAKTKEFNVFSELAKSDKIISSQLNTLVGTRIERSRLELFDVVFRPIYSFLTDTEIIGFDDSIFKAEYLKIENSLYSNDIEIETLTPLCGFFTDTNEILLDENLSIVKLTESETIELLRLGIKIGDSIVQNNFVHHAHQFTIKLTYSLPKLVGDKAIEGGIEAHIPYIKGDQEQKVLDALRIFKDGKVYSLGTITKSNNVFSPSVIYNPGLTSKSFMINKYQLVKNEENDFLEFWETYRGVKIPEKHFLSVAIRRFSQSNERESIEDKIIDLMISAEALFLSSGGSFDGELKYRLSHRAAMFIEDEAENQREVFKFMHKAYNVRSNIVHGRALNLPKKEDGTSVSLNDFGKIVERHLRYSLKKAIKLAESAKSLNNVIDWDSIVFPKEI